MSDEIPSSSPGGPEEPGPEPAGGAPGTENPHPLPLPAWSRDFVGFVQRLLFVLGFALLAWVVFWLILILLAPMQFLHAALTGRTNDELKHLTLRAIHYLVTLLAYIAAVRDEKPFPFAPFPQL
jgi:Domain of unknown function (DUF4389)